MSWLQRLNETYEACFGSTRLDVRGLAPVGSVIQRTQIEVALYDDGTFASATLEDHQTIMFTTEDSASRSGTAPAANPLTEQLEYCAKGMERFEGDPAKHNRYIQLLTSWNSSDFGNQTTAAVLKYVNTGSLLEDLIHERVITQKDGELQKVKVSKTIKLDPAKVWIRWRVQSISHLESATWEDPALQLSWQKFEQSLSAKTALCFMCGCEVRATQKHPKGIRKGGDNAKLISSNDTKGYTFRGRFHSSEEAASLGYESSQKAHNALRWLIKRQGSSIADELVVVAWATGGQSVPKPVVSTLEMFGHDDADELILPEKTPYFEADTAIGDVGQALARKLNKRMQGYRAELNDRADVVVMALDSATPGRMAIVYYRELRGSEFLERIEHWHNALAWPQNFGKELHFVGAPSPRDIAEAAYGRRVDDKLRKVTVERLLPCIVDNRPLPRDLEQAVVRRAINRAGLERWEFERTLGIACSLVRGTHPVENYKMSLEEDRRTRDYLYGRLLAIADSIEEIALSVAGEGRETNAARLMQRFADHPATTWRTLELQLRPYMARLRSSRFAGALTIRQRLLDELISGFPTMDDGNNAFNDNRRLSGEFLLAFHSQREALRPRKPEAGTSAQAEQQGEDQ